MVQGKTWSDRLRSQPVVSAVVGCALFMQALDTTIVATALPAMARSLHQTPVHLNMSIAAYLLGAAAFTPLSGWAADRIGARNIFQLAIVSFLAASLFCGLSRNLAELAVGRLAQGAAGSMFLPVGRLVLLRVAEKSELVQAMSPSYDPGSIGTGPWGRRSAD